MSALALIAAFLLGFALAIVIVSYEGKKAASALEQRIPGGAELARSYLPFRFSRRLTAAINASLEGERALALKERRRSSDLLRMLSDLSHDIRTPLAAAKGHLQLVELDDKGCDAGMSIDANGHLDAALSRIGATSKILDQMLDLTRASDPDKTYELAPTSLLSMVLTVLDNHETEVAALGCEVAFEDEAVLVRAEPASLERIFENLVTNAIRYGQAGLRCAERREGGRVVLAISNGVADPRAIDPSMLFERFYRADSSRAGNGTGLGLAIAKALADGMGMGLTVDLQGGTITFTLAMDGVDD